MTILLGYALTGLLAGFLAGLLGIGGGLVFVPILAALFASQGFTPGLVMPMALGTSLAAIVFTSANSMYAHHAHGAVDWRIFRNMTPGIVPGSLLGSVAVAHVPSQVLRIIFSMFAAFAAIQMLANIQPRPIPQSPGFRGLVAAGGAVGSASTLLGIGGALIAVPFMLWRNVPARLAIGTAAALGVPIAVAGTIGFVSTGILNQNLPDYSLGFVHLPALAAIVATSMFSAPLGASVSHHLPVNVLKKCFAGVLLVTAGKMLFT
jgi:uncharacterized protein